MHVCYQMAEYDLDWKMIGNWLCCFLPAGADGAQVGAAELTEEELVEIEVILSSTNGCRNRIQ